MSKSGLVSRRLTRGTTARHRPILETLEDRTMLDGSGVLDWDPNSYETDQIIVRFKKDVNPNLAVAVAGATLGPRELMTGLNMWVVNLPAGTSVTDAVAAYTNSPDVLYAEPDFIVSAALTPNDPRYANGSLWGLHNTGQSGGVNDADIDAPEAWNISTGSSNVVIAVIDTGIDYNHPDLAANMWTNAGEIPGNLIDDDANGFVDDVYGYDFFNNDGNPIDDNNHGTHCAGTIGGVGNNNTGVTGVNWNVKIMALKFLGASGSGSTSGGLASLNYALARGVSVSSNSWGGGPFSQAFSDALNVARSQGHIFVAAAGNAGTSGAIYPARYTHDNVVGVAASTRTDARASFSQYGAGVDLAAPGADIWSTVRTSQGSYASFNGTSMATPHVAGAVALLKAINPLLPYMDYINAIRNTVDLKPAFTTPVTETGGRLNLFRAASSIVPPPPPPADSSGPYVISQTPTGLVSGPIDQIVVTFNENVDANTFTQADIVQFSGPGGSNLMNEITAILPNNGQVTTFTIKFNPQSAVGPYTIVLGPDIKDTAGNKMNQDLDANNGEDPQDLYTGVFTIGDAVGPQVISQTPVGTVPAPISNVTVTFNELVNATSFTVADITAFTGPGGVNLLPALTGVLPTSGTATTFTITFAAQNTGGNYSLTFGPNIVDTSNNAMNQDGDTNNGEGTQDQYTLNFALTSTTTTTYDSNDVPIDIKDRKTVTSKITVPDSISIQDVNVTFWITHTWDSDLRLQLKSPKGTLITLVNYRGGAGDNFGSSNSQRTTMDDEAVTAISAGFAPFLGTFRPENNNQLSKFDTEDAKGVWTLSIYDRSNGDIGTLNRWSLVISGVAGTGGPSGAGSRSFVGTINPTTGPVALLLPGKKDTAPTAGTKQTGTKKLAPVTTPSTQATDSYFAAEVTTPRPVRLPGTSDSTLTDLAASLVL